MKIISWPQVFPHTARLYLIALLVAVLAFPAYSHSATATPPSAPAQKNSIAQPTTTKKPIKKARAARKKISRKTNPQADAFRNASQQMVLQNKTFTPAWPQQRTTTVAQPRNKLAQEQPNNPNGVYFSVNDGATFAPNNGPNTAPSAASKDLLDDSVSTTKDQIEKGWDIGVGTAVPIQPNLDFNMGFRYSDNNKGHGQDGHSLGSSVGGRGTDQSASEVTMGLRYSF